jgi:hypothetical protein
VKRFVRKLTASESRPFRRIECEPGQEAQIDFGQGAPVDNGSSKRRRPHALRVVLSHSRKGYTEVIDRQTTDGFLQCVENAFWHFGGVPQTVVIDNLRAAVRRADWFDPEINPKVQSFAAHYGTTFLPTRVATPRHKGKVERGVDYVQENALKGRVFDSTEQQNEYLRHWEATVADTRIHGTIREQVQRAFVEREEGALLPLPRDRFPCFEESKRKVHRDGHVTIAKSYYSAPPEYLGREVWVRWDSRLVRIYNSRMEQLAVHVRQSPGKFSTHPAHIVSEKISGVERGAAYWLEKVAVLGPQTRDWSAAMLKARGVEGVRVMMGLWQLTDKHSFAQVERACELALGFGVWRLKSIRQLIAHPDADAQQTFPFLDEHPVIRPLSTYEEFVHNEFSSSFEQE